MAGRRERRELGRALAPLVCAVALGAGALPALPARAEVLLERAAVVTGEWYPYASETLPGAGELSSLVTQALRGMGRLPDYQFLPFSIALERTRNGDSIGTFPWFRTSGRERDFLYSDPILDVEYVIYYNREAASGVADVTAFEDLSGFGTVRVAGYAYGKLDCLVEGIAGDDCTVDANAPDREPSEFRALEKLAAGEIDYFAASRSVGRAIIERSFAWEDRRKFAILEGDAFSWSMGVHFLMPRSHRGAEDLMAQFNASLKELRDEGRVAELRERLDSFAYVDDGFVRLVGADDAPASALMADGRRRALPAGSRAIVVDWGAADWGGARPGGTSLVQLVNGPFRGERVRVDNRSIELE